jgi:hypothetical protein
MLSAHSRLPACSTGLETRLCSRLQTGGHNLGLTTPETEPRPCGFSVEGAPGLRQTPVHMTGANFQAIREHLSQLCLAGTPCCLLAKVDECSESHRAFGLPDDLLAILKDDLAEHGETVHN